MYFIIDITYTLVITISNIIIIIWLQFLQQVSRKPMEVDCSEALNKVNRQKNRYPDRVPCKYRVINTYMYM